MIRNSIDKEIKTDYTFLYKNTCITIIDEEKGVNFYGR